MSAKIKINSWKNSANIPADLFKKFITLKKYGEDVKKTKEQFDNEYKEFIDNSINKEDNLSINKWKTRNNIPTALFKGFLAYKKYKKSDKKSKKEFDKEYNDFLNQKAF